MLHQHKKDSPDYRTPFLLLISSFPIILHCLVLNNYSFKYYIHIYILKCVLNIIVMHFGLEF